MYILDYKPGADKEKPVGQLFIYACCLLVGLMIGDGIGSKVNSIDIGMNENAKSIDEAWEKLN